MRSELFGASLVGSASGFCEVGAGDLKDGVDGGCDSGGVVMSEGIGEFDHVWFDAGVPCWSGWRWNLIPC